MNILFYTILFIIGSRIGVLWFEKAREIPKNLDLKKTYYNNNPNQELISKLTYIFIGGVSTVVLANILSVNIQKIDISNLIIYIFAMIYISILVLIGGIDRVYSKIEKRTISFGIISSIVYLLYLCIVDLTSINLSVIYLAIYMVILVIDSFLLKKFAKDSYIVDLLMLLAIILAYTDLRALTYTVIMALIAILLYIPLLKLQKKKNGNKKIKINEIPVGFFVAASNIIVLFMIRVFENYLILK